MKQGLSLAIVLLFIIGTALSAINTYEQCGTNNIGTLDSVVISGCQPTEVCILKKGTNMTMTMSFTTNSDVTVVKNNVTANIANVQLPFPNFATNACEPQFGLNCPLVANGKNNYMASVSVLKLFPALSTKVTWQLTDDKHTIIVCFMVNVKISD